MGEYAEMMLDGTCCEGCGEYLGGGSPGFPRYCGSCRPKSPGRVNAPKPVVAGSLSPKLLARLEAVRLHTDKHTGYPGDYYDQATRQHDQLIRHGLAAMFTPHNPVHKLRVVITDAGRDLLAKACAQ